MALSRVGNFLGDCCKKTANLITRPFRNCSTRKVKNGFKKGVALPITVVGNFGPSMGNTALNLIQATAYILNQDEETTSSNAGMLTTIAFFMFFDLRINWFGRLHKYQEKFRATPANTPSEPCCKKPDCLDGCGCEACGLNRICLARGIYINTSALGIASGVFTGLATYLGTLFLIEYCQKLGGMSKEDLKAQTELALGFIYFFGALFGVAKLLGFLFYNHEKIRERAELVRARIAGTSNDTTEFHKGALAVTGVVTLLNLFGDLGQSYISTGKGLARLPFNLPPDVIEFTTYISLSSRLFSYLHTQPFALYDALEKFARRKPSSLELQQLKAIYRCKLIEVRAIGILSSIGVGFSNMPGIAKLLQSISKGSVDPQDSRVKWSTLISAFTTAMTNYAFSVEESIENFLKEKLIKQEAHPKDSSELTAMSHADRTRLLKKLLANSDEDDMAALTYIPPTPPNTVVTTSYVVAMPSPPVAIEIVVDTTVVNTTSPAWEKAPPSSVTDTQRLFNRARSKSLEDFREALLPAVQVLTATA